MVNYPGTKLIGVANKLRKKMKNSPTCVQVLHKTLNEVISHCCFAEDGKEMYQNVKVKTAKKKKKMRSEGALLHHTICC